MLHATALFDRLNVLRCERGAETARNRELRGHVVYDGIRCFHYALHSYCLLLAYPFLLLYSFLLCIPQTA